MGEDMIKDILAVIFVCTIGAVALVGVLEYFHEDPKHLEWCEQTEFSNSSCILDHWPGRFQLLGIWMGSTGIIAFACRRGYVRPSL